MAVKASAQITLNSVVDIEATYRYYILQSSTSDPPSAPSSYPPDTESDWTLVEPSYTEDSTKTLYYVDLTVYSDGDYSYSDVSLSTSYEAAKNAYNKASSVESSLNFLSDKLASIVESKDSGTIMIQGEGEWQFNFVDIKNQVDSLINTLNTYNSYIHFTTDEDGNPCIVLGKNDTTDGDFKVKITNKQISFIEGSAIPAKINNETLTIGKAKIENELSQGKFVWMARSNGNYGLMWKG